MPAFTLRLVGAWITNVGMPTVKVSNSLMVLWPTYQITLSETIS